jgi:protein AATF/BFR2
MKLLSTLDALREEMNAAAGSAKVGGKRKRTMELNTPSSEIWKNLQDSESTAIETRQSTLEKWSARVRDATALPVSSKLNNTARQQTITDVLQEQLSNSDRLIKRTKMPRSCAPVQAKLKITEDPHIYDDADFYQLLLKELVDQRMMDSSSTSAPSDGGRPVAQWTAVKEAKTKKNVDTKASKGRKMRYTVHEKLQNFMAPEDRGSWEQDAVDRFFGTLLGQKVSLGEDDVDENVSDEGEGAPLAEEALMLFRS